MPQDVDAMLGRNLSVYNTDAISTVLTAANIDQNGLSVPDAGDIDLIENDTEAALVADRAFRALHIAMGRAWVVMAEYAELVHRRKLWQHLASDNGTGFTSFKDWCENATGKGRTTVYGEMTLVRELGLPREQLTAISKANLFTLLKVKRRAGASKLTPDLLAKAEAMDDPTFAKHCYSLLPGAAGDEAQYTVKFALDDSMNEVFRDTVEMLQVLCQTNDWNAIIERMCVAVREADFGNETGQLDGLVGMSNWDAFSQIRSTLAATGAVIKRSGKKIKGAAVTPGIDEDIQPDPTDQFVANTDGLVESEGAPALGVDEMLALMDAEEDAAADGAIAIAACPQCGVYRMASNTSPCGGPCK